MNTKILLFASLALNVVLGGLLAYQYFFRPEKSDMPVVESVAPAFQMEVKDNDVVFMGESRLGACNWAVFLSDETCRTLAFDGNTIDDENKRLDQLFKDVSPRKFILMYGEKELLDGEEVGQIAEKYERLVSRLKERFPSTECVLMSVLPVWKENDNEFNLAMSSKIKNLNIFVKTIASRHDYPYIDLFKELSTAEENLNPRYGKPGGFKLNQTAYVIMRERIRDYLK